MNTIGENLRVSVFGQSHGEAIGAVIDGFPAGLRPDRDALNRMMRRRAPGSSPYATARKEPDEIEIISGLNERGETCGHTICGLIRNRDARSADYEPLRDVPRPGHADFPARLKYGESWDGRGGGAFSGRMTAPLCFAGALCLQWLEARGIRVFAHIAALGGIQDEETMTPPPDDFPVFNPDARTRMAAALDDARARGDSLGGVIRCAAAGVPGGIGGPLFEGLESRLAFAMMAIPGARGVEFGDGFAAANLCGSQHNDAYGVVNGAVQPLTNHAGGILGGMTTGQPLLLRVPFKPTSSIAAPQQSVNLRTMTPVVLSVPGRHDPCIVLRAVPVVESLTAIVLMDQMLR